MHVQIEIAQDRALTVSDIEVANVDERSCQL